MVEFVCDRCGQSFALESDHTKLVRRDFQEEPRPIQVTRLCRECLADYEAFMTET